MMDVTQDQLAPHLARFTAMLDARFREYGCPDGLPDRMRAAVLAVPRHLFVHRYRLGVAAPGQPQTGPLTDFDADPAAQLGTVYSDQVMRHVDAAGEALPSSNSQPSYVLWLLHLLDLQPGQSVLEVGSGSGWLAAIMAQLVGPGGQVTGIEIIPDLAAQSRADLARAGVGTVRIHTGDGTLHPGEPGRFDRAMVTAGTWDVPGALFDAVEEGGVLLVPVELRGGFGCQVAVLRRTPAGFTAERSVLGWFVPLTGPGQGRPEIRPFPPDAPTSRWALPLGRCPGQGGNTVAEQFGAFLGRTEPGFARFGDWFGLATPGSAAVCREGEVLGYGSPDALRRLLEAFQTWSSLGLPAMDAFALEVVRAATVPPNGPARWVEPRHDSALVWRLRPAGTPWQAMIRDCEGGISKH